MCIGTAGTVPPQPTPPPPPPPPPTEVASAAAKAGTSRRSGRKKQRGTLALTRGPQVGGSYTGSGVNLPT
jgi:hypothetical protein